MTTPHPEDPAEGPDTEPANDPGTLGEPEADESQNPEDDVNE